MRYLLCVCAAVGLLAIVGCTSPQERKAEADAAYAEEKLQILKEYRACLKEHPPEEASARCGHLEKAAQATRD